MPAERSSSSSSPPSHGGRLYRPMSLSRILRGPGYSPSIRSSAAATGFTPHSSATSSPLSASTRTPRARGGSVVHHGSAEDQTPQNSPNPFVVSTPTGTPTTPHTILSYPSQVHFNDPLTSPVVDSPTNGGSRALRRHGAVALLVPQTPSASNWPARASPATNSSSPPGQSAGSVEDTETTEPASKNREAPEHIGDGMSIRDPPKTISPLTYCSQSAKDLWLKIIVVQIIQLPSKMASELFDLAVSTIILLYSQGIVP